MRSAILGFVVGAAWLQTQPDLPGMWLMLALVAAVLLWALAIKKLPHWIARSSWPAWLTWPSWRVVALAAGGVLAGFVWAALFAHYSLREELPEEWEGRDITVIGTIDSLPHRFERGIRFNFAVERVLPEGGGDADAGASAARETAELAADAAQAATVATVSTDAAVPLAAAIPVVPSRLALSWYGGFRGEATQTVPGLLPGERWQLTVRLRRPHGNANPHGFDYEVWLLEQGLRATGTVRPDRRLDNKNEKRDDFVPGFSNAVERSRNWLRERIVAALPGKEYAGVIVALVVGDQRAIAQSDWQVFNRTGIGHLISISGLHITMVAGLFAGLFQFLWRRSFFTRAQLPLLLPAQKAAALAGVAMALVYVLLAGFGVPAQRTLYMLTVVAVALWCDRLTSVSHVLCLALGVVILLDPWAVLWPGFWLSFGAVAAILYVSVGRVAMPRAMMPPALSALATPAAITGAGSGSGMRKAAGALAPLRQRWQTWRESLRQAGRTQYAVTLGLVPLTMLLFGQVSLVSPLANALAIPLVSFIVTPLALAGSVLPAPLSDWILGFAHACVVWLAQAMAWLAALPAAVWSAPLPHWWIFAAALVGTVWLLAPRGWPLRWLGLAGWLPLLLNAPASPPAGELWVTAFDVGQGTALLIETPGRRLLYDTGPVYSPDSDGGSRVIVPYLKARGIDRLDGMIVSHSDTDHAGGALSLLDEVAVDWVSSSMAEDNPIVRAAAEHRRCQAGQAWDWDGMRFEMLHPSPASYDNPHLKPNSRSCALKITHGAQAILLPGDVERIDEAELLDVQGERLRATVLLAPHHGSGTSSTLSFLQAVDPQLALFQVGYRNRYKHPKREVYERYGELGIRRLRSDESGAVTLRFGAALEVDEYRGTHARYWYGR
ncbi:DNA internalization-related competence protein ComEC/Rec2 [Noviherbaspirillum sedimenti]|uniref:DNA internalization-related competence protein ComEC/Rec2 n=1 Tax=Noviherbaspirillum sedimenti TaxID=2320865 RepID=A0A3A3GDB0_9BURK|nr:DNA internalization-related competence protein ComEC/Rec2 [Noviherbaspirillum sedimenti]RJG00216.1 DNA internalization-related competence protein ComEC/Rec2 [Noviherbaspirillum sedimenti]